MNQIVKCNALQSEQWYISLCEDCRDIVVETEFASRWTLIEGYHSLGSRIIQESNKLDKLSSSGIDVISQVAVDIERSRRTVYYAIQFAKTYPDLNLLPEGKNCSWHRIINKYLTKDKDKVIPKKSDLYKMIKDIKELLQTEWYKANQEGNESRKKYIRYLQDMVDKIIRKFLE